MIKHHPDFIYIGFQKAGSTYLRSYFSFHPDISWSRNALFFQSNHYAPDAYIAQTSDPKLTTSRQPCFIDMYESLAMGYVFEGINSWQAKDALIPGSSLSKSRLVYSPRVLAERIHAAVPDGKIIITIRNPVSWIRSNYLHFILSLPTGQRSFRDFISTTEGMLVLKAAHFHETISLYQEIFGRDKVLIIPLEELQQSDDRAIFQLCNFLGVPRLPFPKKMKNHNTGMGTQKAKLVKLASTMRIPDGIMRALSPAYSFSSIFLKKMLEEDVLTDFEISYLQASYAASNLELSKCLGRDLSELGYLN